MRGLTLIRILRTCENGEGTPIELWMNGAGTLLIRAYNESGYCFTELPLLELMSELREIDGSNNSFGTA